MKSAFSLSPCPSPRRSTRLRVAARRLKGRCLKAGAQAGVVLATIAFLATTAAAYPLDGYTHTSIVRLHAYELAQQGKVSGPTLPSGALLPSSAIHLQLVDQPDFDLPAASPQWNAKLRELLGPEADRYGVAILDLTNPQQPRYGEHRSTVTQNPGSVGKILVALALFQALADLYPDDLEARLRILRETRVVADSVIQSDHHTVPFWNEGDAKVVRRSLREGDEASLWTYLDWMASSSSNAAASAVMKQLLLLRHFGKEYPVSPDKAESFLRTAPKKDLSAIWLEAMTAPVSRNTLDLTKLRQGSFFTRAGKSLVPGTTSYATPRELLMFLLRIEQGRLADAFSSLEMKKLLYLTDRRIRYGSSPALREAAVYFKSGSWFGCEKEEGFTCRPYAGNVRNFMNSIAIVETPGREPKLHYLVVVMSNVLRKNSAVVHQTLATRIHRWMEGVHPRDEPQPEPSAAAHATPAQ